MSDIHIDREELQLDEPVEDGDDRVNDVQDRLPEWGGDDPDGEA